MNLSPLPIQKFFANNGRPLAGGLLFTYEAGTSDKAATYTDISGGSLNTNPIVLDYRGECRLWLDIEKSYKLILSPEGDSDPPTNPIWTADNITAPVSLVDLTAQVIGLILYPQTSAEFAAGVTPTNYTYPQDAIQRYGGIMDSSAARIENSAALLTALSVARRCTIPDGTLWIDADTQLSGLWNIEGNGSAVTTIKGDGDLFNIQTADNGEMRRFAHLTILNDVTKGKLIKYTLATDTNRVEFDHVNFGTANYHVHTSGGGQMVAWKFGDCRFIDAAIESRHFEGLWVYHEDSCYTWFCGVGLSIVDGNLSTCSIDASTYEQMDSSAIILDASNASFEIAAFRINAHFEVNGKTDNAADVQVITSAATRARAVVFEGCGFFLPTVTQTERVTISAGGGGNIDQIIFDGCACMGAVQLCSNVTAAKVRNTYFQSLTPRSSNVVPVEVQYQYSGVYLGSVRVTGTLNGNLGVQALVTPPSGTRTVNILVEGSNYNGVPNSNIALLQAWYSASNGNVRTITDVDNSAGVNQGFIASWTGTQIQVTNKTAMSFSQSGDTLLAFWA